VILYSKIMIQRNGKKHHFCCMDKHKVHIVSPRSEVRNDHTVVTCCDISTTKLSILFKRSHTTSAQFKISTFSTALYGCRDPRRQPCVRACCRRLTDVFYLIISTIQLFSQCFHFRLNHGPVLSIQREVNSW